MSYVIATPEAMTTAATDLAGIGSTLSAARMTAALPTAAVIVAADELSASIVQLFSQYGGAFRALAGQASMFHDQFVHNLKASAGVYTSAETANAALLKPGSLSGLWSTRYPRRYSRRSWTLRASWWLPCCWAS